MTKQRKTLWNIRVRPKDEPMFARLTLAATLADRSAAQLVREAIREKLESLAAKYPQINEIPATQQTVNN